MDFYTNLKVWEGSKNFMYLDNRGLVTTGIGNLLATPEAAIGLPWILPGGKFADEATIRRGWSDVHGSKAGLRADAYAGVCGLRLLEADIIKLVDRRLETEFLPGLRTLVSGFDDLPEPAQDCLVDLAYNLGVNGLSKFKGLLAAVRSESWFAAAQSCSVKTSRPERNDWRKQQFEKCGAA